MNNSVLTTIAVTGFTIAFFHAAIPTHWLPFVLTARAQHWNRSKTLVITAIAATGHACFTATLGLIVAWLGIVLSARIGALFPWIAGGALISFGLFYLIRQLTGHTHTHLHLGNPGHSHDHPHHHGEKRMPFSKSDLAAIASLLALLTFSPCEAFVPVYV
jgi:nickel/cobalt transporter (NicO) family protein